MAEVLGSDQVIICVDGNDGTGKSSLISRLKALFPFFIFQDRGLPSALTINETHKPADLYIILSCPVEVSLERLKKAGRDMSEHWHLPNTLDFYHHEFLKLACKHNWSLLNSDCDFEDLVLKAHQLIDSKIKE